ncbi:amidohydrolase family protein [Niabella ginsengisoli]|uniref:Amidohydrolase family protein n=1 Tax=Niabella ginsengisoli TaxID=522298 RepID=A0ABS9SK92_9BACT|nr:amidohydrolase family protein [Niabella ginsengisoli]MCH5598760.1 amidohydrolase family protein [Niabella ginsengisoli]
MIVDTHVHIWNLQRSNYDWLKGAPELLNKNYSLNELEVQRSKASIDAGLLVQAENSLEDTALMLEAANEHEWIKGVVGWLPLMEPSKTERLFQTHVSQEKYFKGVRHLIHDEPDDEWLLQDTVIDSLKLLASYQIPYDIVGVKPAHIRVALKLAEVIPNLKMVFDHLNQPPVQAGKQFGEWGELMNIASQHPNFYAKISGLGTTAGKQLFTVEHIKPYIDFVINKFGTARCFCGGDWPVSLLGVDYVSTWIVYKQVIDELLPDEKQQQKVFSENAISFYNLV